MMPGIGEHEGFPRQSNSAPQGQITARGDYPRSGKLGVDAEGNAIYKARHGRSTRLVARGDDDPDSGRGGVDLDGNPIYKTAKGHRFHRNRKLQVA